MKTIQKKLFLLLFLLPFSIFAQSTLKGTVLDNLGQELPGVSIVIKGTTNGVATDFDGNFTLSNIKKGDVVTFSFVGFKKQELVYDNQKDVSISMQVDATQLADIIVIGYGTTTKKDATGSLTSVTSKEFNKGSIVSADQLLTGKAAGVRITSNGGQPDSAPNIRIRGGSSLNANNNPLIVIDGIAIDSQNPAGVSNPLSLINPNDIESFTVLKDASATAIYGSRASSGVIIITTKKGTSGEPQYNYSANFTSGRVSKKINVMNSADYVKFIQQYHPTLTNSLGIADPNAPAGTVDDLSTPQIEGRIIADTDWQDAILRNSFSTDHNFSARANLFGNTPFRASIGYTKNEGLVKTNDYERYSYSLKLTPSYLDNHLKVDLNAKGIISNKNVVDDGGALGGAVNMDPTKPIYDNSATNIFGGFYQNTRYDGGRLLLDGQSNPLALLEQRSRPEKALRFLGNLQLDYKMHFLPELRAVVNLGIDASKSKISETYDNNASSSYAINQNTLASVFNPGLNYLENQTKTNGTLDSYLQYTKSLNGFVSKFDVQGGYSYQNFRTDGDKTIFRNNPDTGIREELINENNIYNRYFNELNLQSFFGRTNIDFANKYLVTLSFRADGSSLFRPDKRWGYFPAAAIAWKIKDENFVKDSKFVNDLKLRIGWGKTGQQDITGSNGFFPSVPTFTIGSPTSQYLPNQYLYQANAYNPDLTWEKTTTVNIGLDYAFFKNDLINGSLDFYKRETNDLLAVVPFAAGQFLTNQFSRNVGSTESKGFELALNINAVTTENFNLSFNTNTAYNFSEITDLENITQLPGGLGLPTGTGVSAGINAVGYQPGSGWMFQQLYNEVGNPIVGAYVDRNGDNQITNDDRYYIPVTPNWTFGFGLNTNYKNWDLSTSFRGQYGGQIYNARKLTSGWVNKALPVNSNSLSNVLNFYEGSADVNFTTVQGNIPFSDYFLEDASFIRCENIVLGYKFNKFYKSASLRVYGAVNNAFVITKYSGQDPENFGGVDNNFYPRPRLYSLGINLDF